MHMNHFWLIHPCWGALEGWMLGVRHLAPPYFSLIKPWCLFFFFYYYSPPVASVPESPACSFVTHGNNIKAADWLWHLWVISILQKFDHILFEFNLFIVMIKHKKSCGQKYHVLSDCGLHWGVLLRNNENLSQTCLCASLCSHILFLTSVS